MAVLSKGLAFALKNIYISGADPGFSLGGGANPLGGGANLRFYQKFPKNLHEIEKILDWGGALLPLRSATVFAKELY